MGEVLLFDTAQPMVENCICVQSVVLSTIKEQEKVLRAIKVLENMTHSLGFSADLFYRKTDAGSVPLERQKALCSTAKRKTRSNG